MRLPGSLLLLIVALAVALLAPRNEWFELLDIPAAIPESDFQLHWAAGRVLAEGGDAWDSAQVNALGARTGRAFTPFCAANPLLARLFGLSPGAPRADGSLDIAPAYGRWLAVNLVLLALSTLLLALCWRGAGALLSAALALAAALLLLCDGTWMATWYNQLNGVTMLTVFGALLAGQRGRHALEGALLALATFAKLSPGLLLVVALLAGRRRTALAGLLTGAALAAVSFVALGPEPHVQWLAAMSSRLGYEAAVPAGEFNNSLHAWNFAPNGLLSRAALAAHWPPGLARAAAWGVTALVLGVLFAWLRRAPAARRIEAQYAAALAASYLVSSVTWATHLSLLALPAGWLVLRAWVEPSGPRRLAPHLLGALAVTILMLPLGSFGDPQDMVADTRLKAGACLVLCALLLAPTAAPQRR